MEAGSTQSKWGSRSQTKLILVGQVSLLFILRVMGTLLKGVRKARDIIKSVTTSPITLAAGRRPGRFKDEKGGAQMRDDGGKNLIIYLLQSGLDSSVVSPALNSCGL